MRVSGGSVWEELWKILNTKKFLKMLFLSLALFPPFLNGKRRE